MIKKLRRKFVLTNMVFALLMLIIVFVLIVSMTGQSMVREGVETLRESYIPDKEDSAQVDDAAKTEPPPKDSGSQRPKEEKKDEKDDKGHHSTPTLRLYYDEAGSLVVGGSDVFDLSDPTYLKNILDAAMSENSEYGILWSEDLRYLRIEREDYDLYIFGDISTEKTTIKNLLIDILMIGVISLLGFFFMSLLLSRWAVKPTEKAWTKQRQFVADASHELKTPLTVISTNVELLQGEKLTDEQRIRCVENIAAMSHQMRALTEELLTLARTDDSNSEYLAEPLDLAALVEDAAMSFEALFFEKGLTLETVVPSEPMQYKGNKAHLQRLTEILLDNAQKYSLPGEVYLKLVRQHGNAVLTVTNPAEPLSDGVMQHLFDRFYQADCARSSGYGLGLSIARNIVLRHGGQISATCSNRQITFCVRLPLH